MDVLVSLEHRFARTPDGAVWTQGINAYDFWTRYLTAFDRVKVLARIYDVPRPAPDWHRADGPGVAFVTVPNYLGPWQYLAQALPVRRALRIAVGAQNAVIMRVGSHIAGCLQPWVVRDQRPYGLEVVNDPYDVFAPGSVRCALRPILRWWFTRQLRWQCHGACGVAYVTETTLQRRYPCAGYSAGMSDVEISEDALVGEPNVFTTHYSSVELAEEDAVCIGRQPGGPRQRFRLITIASLAQMYKAPDILIRAVGRSVEAGLDLTLEMVGDGKHRPELEKLVESLGLKERVRFAGQVPAGPAVRARLDAADLFVLPSRCEGLPRAMVEAMARALPCIGSTVGGIPELLPASDLVPPGDVLALAGKIQEVLRSSQRMAEMSARNLTKAQDYRDDVLDRRRRAFFEHIRQTTAEWLERPLKVEVLCETEH
jgi:glycosyltransferase involved in cell wall biosynthesis